MAEVSPTVESHTTDNENSENNENQNFSASTQKWPPYKGGASVKEWFTVVLNKSG